MTSCLVVQHLEPEAPYAIGDALEAAGVQLDVRRTFAGDRLPEDVRGFGALVVMGGPMSARSDSGFSTRRAELGLLADAVARATPTLAVCLGAQLLAVAAGGRVSDGARGPEVGWGTVDLTVEARGDRLFSGLAPTLTVLHWHGETFTVPRGSIALAKSALYDEQAFRVGEAAWGLQFHLEVDERAVESFCGTFAADALAARTTPGEIRAASPASLDALLPQRDKVLERFAGLVVAHDELAALTTGRDT
jgi:GMP synthase-like glutamine amidotransferase